MNSNKDTKYQEDKEVGYKYFWLIVAISILLVLGLWIWNWLVLNEYPEETRGTHGDMFGAVNAIFSGLAFAGIIISLYLQRIDLKNQFEEIKKTNEEFEKQNKTIHIQKFENQYYKMIDLHKQNVNEISIPYFETVVVGKNYSKILREVNGRKGFIDMVKELEICLEKSNEILKKLKYNKEDIFNFAYKIFFWGVYSDFSNSSKIEESDQKTVKDSIKQVQNDFKSEITKSIIDTRYVPFQGHESRLAHYYRHLFQIVKYVEKQEKDGVIMYEETRQYLRVLRAQLSNSEQLMLYYNYICGFGENWDKLGEKKYQFFTKYRMIHNIPIDRVKFVENPREHFNDYIENLTDKNDTLFEWGDSQ